MLMQWRKTVEELDLAIKNLKGDYSSCG